MNDEKMTEGYREKHGLQTFEEAPALPLPLTKEEEAAAIADLQTEFAAAAQSCLVEHNLRLVAYIAWQYREEGTEIAELISVGTIGLIKAVRSYRPERNCELATYAGRCIRNELRMYLREIKKNRLELPTDPQTASEADGSAGHPPGNPDASEDTAYQRMEEKLERMILRKALAGLGRKEKRIVQLRYGFDSDELRGKTQTETAARIGISQSYLSRMEKVIIEKLRREFLRASFVVAPQALRSHSRV